MLKTLVNQLDRSLWKRHLFFLGSALCAILIVGYHYGTFDMAIHIPFLKAMADPSLFPNDSYIALRSTYFSYFWPFFIPFQQMGHLPEALFLIHIFSVYLIFWSVWEISATLFRNPLSSLFATLAFIAPRLGFVGFPVIEFGVMSRTFVLPFALFAINRFLQRRIVSAFFLIGLMYNLHVVTVNFILAMFLLDCILEYKQIGIKNILLGLGAFVLAALPVLIWKSGSSAAPIDFSLRPQWYEFLVSGMLMNVFVLFSTYPHILAITAGGFCALILYLIASDQRVTSTGTEATLKVFIVATLVILLVGQNMTLWLPMTILIQSQINRAGLFMLILAYIYFAGTLARRFETEAEPGRLLPVSLAFFLSPTPILPVAVALIQKLLPSRPAVQVGLRVGTILLIVSAYLVTWQMQYWNPSIEIYGENTPWKDVQLWAKNNTSKDAIFITPPEKFGFYQSDWRVYSERSSFATYSELLVAAFNPDYTDGWVNRFSQVAPGAMHQFDGDYFANTRITQAAYGTLSAAQVQKLACANKLSYIVTEKPHTMPFKQVYENGQFTVYDLRTGVCDGIQGGN
jgi:hypothetical protein